MKRCLLLLAALATISPTFALPPGEFQLAPRPVAAADDRLTRGTRPVWSGAEWVQTPVLRGEPAAGTEAEGPVVFELPEATLVLPAGWSAAVDERGTINARFERDEMHPKGTAV